MLAPMALRRTGGMVLVLVLLLGACEPDGDKVIETAPPIVEVEPTTSTSTSTSTTTTSTTTTSTSTTTPTTTPSTTVARPPTTAATVARPTPTTRAAGGCDPNYAGACVPIDSDVDCGGGSGNGPSYVYAKRFQVVGTDIYGLDADNDGIACES
jgi:resuscitation-promoting factor RpfB